MIISSIFLFSVRFFSRLFANVFSSREQKMVLHLPVLHTTNMGTLGFWFGFTFCCVCEFFLQFPVNGCGGP